MTFRPCKPHVCIVNTESRDYTTLIHRRIEINARAPSVLPPAHYSRMQYLGQLSFYPNVTYDKVTGKHTYSGVIGQAHVLRMLSETYWARTRMPLSITMARTKHGTLMLWQILKWSHPSVLMLSKNVSTRWSLHRSWRLCRRRSRCSRQCDVVLGAARARAWTWRECRTSAWNCSGREWRRARRAHRARRAWLDFRQRLCPHKLAWSAQRGS